MLVLLILIKEAVGQAANIKSKKRYKAQLSLLLEEILFLKYTHILNSDALIFIKIAKETFGRWIDNDQYIDAVAVIKCKQKRHKGQSQLMH